MDANIFAYPTYVFRAQPLLLRLPLHPLSRSFPSAADAAFRPSSVSGRLVLPVGDRTKSSDNARVGAENIAGNIVEGACVARLAAEDTASRLAKQLYCCCKKKGAVARRDAAGIYSRRITNRKMLHAKRVGGRFSPDIQGAADFEGTLYEALTPFAIINPDP